MNRTLNFLNINNSSNEENINSYTNFQQNIESFEDLIADDTIVAHFEHDPDSDHYVEYDNDEYHDDEVDDLTLHSIVIHASKQQDTQLMFDLLIEDNNILNKLEYGWGPLHWLAIDNDVSACNFLITMGSDINVIGESGKTPLHLVCLFGNLQICLLLIKYGSNLEICDNDGWRPLHFAASTNNINITKALLCAGADINAMAGDIYHGRSPAFCAGENGFLITSFYLYSCSSLNYDLWKKNNITDTMIIYFNIINNYNNNKKRNTLPFLLSHISSDLFYKITSFCIDQSRTKWVHSVWKSQ
jgi:ankyrin repeat protein